MLPLSWGHGMYQLVVFATHSSVVPEPTRHIFFTILFIIDTSIKFKMLL